MSIVEVFSTCGSYLLANKLGLMVSEKLFMWQISDEINALDYRARKKFFHPYILT